MAKLPKPQKPLKILTIDGGGLQGISTLLILDKLLSTIARNNGMKDTKPRPCDVFDVIAGIGPGGWLALLLGRFQMDVSAALAEWYNLIDCIAPRSWTEELFMRLMQRSYFDTDRLVEQIDQLTDFYKIDKHMFFAPPNGTRCKHVFVSALKIDFKDSRLGYNLFRTYDCPEGCKLKDGPSDPRKYRISHAFGVTGAAKYFTPPWKETSATKVKSKFLDTKFPSPHNITDLALDEMWGLYGTDVEISVVVNIGPGTPNASDYRKIARRFSWGIKEPTTSAALQQIGGSSGVPEVSSKTKGVGSNETEPRDEMSYDKLDTSHRVKFDRTKPVPAGDSKRKRPLARPSSFGSEKDVGIEEKLRRDETKIEDDIRTKLRNIYKENIPPYYRLAPKRCALGTVQNDTSFPKASYDAAMQYLDIPRVEADMEEVGQRVHLEDPTSIV